MLLRRHHQAAEAPKQDAPDESTTDESGAPAGNASRETWEEYALANGRTAEDLEGLSRNEVRDLFEETE